VGNARELHRGLVRGEIDVADEVLASASALAEKHAEGVGGHYEHVQPEEGDAARDRGVSL